VRMERDGLIVRTPDPADGRSSFVSLTEDGEARMPEACKVLFQGNREALDGFTAEEATQFVRLLVRLIANLDRIAGLEETELPAHVRKRTRRN
jgi:MarR family transcriptional regulator, transcriptional regulator for hemolysin